MKKVKVEVRDLRNNKIDFRSFHLADDGEASLLYGLLANVRGGNLKIYNEEIMDVPTEPKGKVGTIEVQAQLEEISDVNSDPLPSLPSNYSGTFELTPDNMQFVGMLIKMTTGKYTLSSLSTTSHVK